MRWALRSTSSRPPRSDTSGSRTATGSQETCGGGRGSPCCCRVFLVSFALAARRSASDADLVHAHWLPSGLVALATGKPFVVQLWGTDVELARRARVALPADRAPRAACGRRVEVPGRRARELGAREVRVIPSGGRDPGVGRRAGRPTARPLRRPPLAPRRGSRSSSRRPRGCRGVIVGAGPVDVPEAVGFVPRARARRLVRARGGRLRPLAPRGLRRRRAGGDGVRAAGRRDRRRVVSWMRSRTV